MNEFLQRLKERKLVQWAVAYVAAAFALLQGIDIVAQRFDWREYTMRLVISGLSVGFCVTRVLAWYHGERGAQRMTGMELLILALLLGLGAAFSGGLPVLHMSKSLGRLQRLPRLTNRHLSLTGSRSRCCRSKI
jgi:hypothetical protein